MDEARAMLNALMGGDRDKKAEDRKIRKFTDDDVCKSFLLGLCPHDLFKNTKIDLGSCEKDHNDYMKEAFEKDAEFARYKRKWRRPLQTQLKRLLEGVDRRIGSNQLRIAREKEGGPAGASEEQKANLNALREQVSDKLKEAEQAAEDGNFENSRNIVKDTEATKRRIEDLEQKRYEKYRKEDICDICGLIIDDEEREAMKTGRGWHSNGKQHIGYGLIRDKLKELETEQAEDRKNGVRSPSPSPVKVTEKSDVKRRKASKSRSLPTRKNRSRSQKRRHKSRSPSKGKKVDSKKRKVSRSRSRRRKASRSRSGAKKKSDDKRSKSRKSRSRSGAKKKNDDKRSRSRKKKSRSRSRKVRSPSKKKKDKKAKDPSPKRKSKSPEKEKEQKKKDKKKEKKGEESAKADAKEAKGVSKPPADAASAKAAEDESARNRKAPVFMVFRPKTAGDAEKADADAAVASAPVADAPAPPAPAPDPPAPAPPAPAPDPPAPAPAPAPVEADESVRNRKAPVFMTFKRK